MRHEVVHNRHVVDRLKRLGAVKAVAAHSDVLLVLGSSQSSNSVRLAEVGRRAGARAYLIDDANDLDMGWPVAARSVGVTAGASAPEMLVQGVIDHLAQSSMRRASWSGSSCRGCWPAECVWIGIEAGTGSAGANWLRPRAKYGFLRSSAASQIAIRTAISRR